MNVNNFKNPAMQNGSETIIMVELTSIIIVSNMSGDAEVFVKVYTFSKDLKM